MSYCIKDKEIALTHSKLHISMPEFIISKDISQLFITFFVGCIQGAGDVGTKTDKMTQVLPFKDWQAWE